VRKVFPKEVEDGRVVVGKMATKPGDRYGAFRLRYPEGTRVWLTVIVGGEEAWEAEGMPPPAWEHLSASCQNRCPDWVEICWLKSLFFEDDECCVQYHPARADYINNHNFVLHVWRLVGQPFPMPPKECV
jgi:hypothetical protein